MGDVADMMLEGDLCGGCGVYLPGQGQGEPRYCRDCRCPTSKACRPKTDHPMTRCKACNRKVKLAGINDHMRDAHKSTGATT